MQRLIDCRSAATLLLGGLVMLALLVSCSDRLDPLGPAVPGDRALPALPADLALRIVSGDGQNAVVGMPLSEQLVVEVVDATGAPVPDVRVRWTVLSGEGSLREASGQTDADGRHANHFTPGEDEGVVQEVRVEVAAAEAVTFTLSVIPDRKRGTSTRTWTGAVSRSWENPANWAPRGVPAPDDVVVIAGHPSRSPMLGANASVSSIEVKNNARLDVAEFVLVVEVDVIVRNNGAIVGSTGQVTIVGGDCRLMGAVPNLMITGVVQMLDATTVRGQLTISGQFSQGGHQLQVLGG